MRRKAKSICFSKGIKSLTFPSREAAEALTWDSLLFLSLSEASGKPKWTQQLLLFFLCSAHSIINIINSDSDSKYCVDTQSKSWTTKHCVCVWTCDSVSVNQTRQHNWRPNSAQVAEVWINTERVRTSN